MFRKTFSLLFNVLEYSARNLAYTWGEYRVVCFGHNTQDRDLWYCLPQSMQVNVGKHNYWTHRKPILLFIGQDSLGFWFIRRSYAGLKKKLRHNFII